VFADEFDGNALDLTKWNIDIGDGCPDPCDRDNNELQEYSADNITVAKGLLTIQARQELDGSFTSARINSRGKFDFRYGRVEVRARLPAGRGLWPAIWLLHSDSAVYGPWPASGEIDIVEAFDPGNGNNEVRSATQYGIPTDSFAATTSNYDLGVSPDMAFHDFTLEWEANNIRFYVDGQHYQTQRSDDFGDESDSFDGWYAYYPADEGNGLYDEFGPFRKAPKGAPFDQLFHLIMNLAVGGDPVGNPDSSALPQNFEIDYVRVYECINGNPETAEGCGTASSSAFLLRDGDGGALEEENLGQPYVDALDLYIDGPEVIELNTGTGISTNTLIAESFAAPGATVASEPLAVDPGDPANVVWQLGVSGGTGGVALLSEDLSEDEVLDTGFDFSDNRNFGIGGNSIGEIAFRMRVDSIAPGTSLFFVLDSGDGNASEAELPASELRLGEWKTYSMKFDRFEDNPVPGGEGVDFGTVLKPFVLEVRGGSADLLLDDIRATTACKVISACGVDLKIKALPDVIVYDDAVNLAVWDLGIRASDSGSNFEDYTDPSNPANKANWREILADEPERLQVIEVTFNDSSAFGVWFIQSSGPRNLSGYAGGAVEFDIKVLDYAGNEAGMTMKIDCNFPCTSGERQLGLVGDGEWETVVVPVASLIGGGLDIVNVNTGLVVFPTSQNLVGQQVFLLDNIKWVSTTEAPPVQQIDLPVTFDEPNVDYTLTDFGGTTSFVAIDPDDPGNRVAKTTKELGADLFAGTIVGTAAGFANPIAFTDTAQTLSLRVRPPGPGIPVLLKIEVADDQFIFEQVTANTTATETWETLVFDFRTVGLDPAIPYQKAVLFFDANNIGLGGEFFWDDLQLGTGE
jgi:beta-glucanase (GH16 family)